jgi:hypothetical protein
MMMNDVKEKREEEVPLHLINSSNLFNFKNFYGQLN